MASRKKPSHKAVELKTVKGRKGTYIWMRTPTKPYQYHVFREVTAFEAAKDCGVKGIGKNGNKKTVPTMCKEVWDKS